ncbi:hypothetical protein ACH5RR_012484 [Cinchona calisaya]|uniref:Uncharacterized protein n=1 Tax=Cinchona calisaya TaxID=153742 RepID=A0ABD3A9H3_9GENT
MRKEELGLFVKSLKPAAVNRDVVDVSAELLRTPNLADYYPYIVVLDLQGLNKKMKAIANVFDEFLGKIIDEHEKSDYKAGQGDDFVYTNVEPHEIWGN